MQVIGKLIKYSIYLFVSIFGILYIGYLLTPQSKLDQLQREHKADQEYNIKHCTQNGLMYLPGSGCVSIAEFGKAVQEHRKQEINSGLK